MLLKEAKNRGNDYKRDDLEVMMKNDIQDPKKRI